MIAYYGRFIIKPYTMPHNTIMNHMTMKAKLSKIAKNGTNKYNKVKIQHNPYGSTMNTK